MKRLLFFMITALLAVSLAAPALAGEGKLNLKVGQEIYACNCGSSCPCQTMSTREGNCTCGNKLVKAKVVKVEGDTAYLQAAGWEKPRAFNMVGKYACACGPSCNCNTISQNPGKCTCGKDMKPVK